MSQVQSKLRLFFSYSHKDEKLRNELANHLSTLTRLGVIDSWYDRKIIPGKEWDKQINENLNTADIILLLVSADFIASDYCWDVEVQTAITRHNTGDARVIPVILRDVDWKDTLFGKLQFLPKDAQAVTSWPNQDAAFKNVAQGIRDAVQDLIRKREQKQAKKEADSTKYRQHVEESLVDGEITVVGDLILQKEQQKLGLTDQEAIAIQQQVLKSHREYQQHLKQYRQVFINLIAQQGYPLPERTKDELKRLQNTYELEEKDIAFEFETANIIITNPGQCEIKYRRGQAEFFTENLDNGINIHMVAIPGGQFLMGSPESEEDRISSESPQHIVKIQPFFMGKFPVTQAQWRVVAVWDKVNIDLDPDPSRFKGNNRPVECVSWDDAVEFCQRLSKRTNKTYRLPSEAEWEYACRAGTTTPFCFGETITTELANYDGNYTYGAGSKGEYRVETTDVGSFPANLFGLYDLHGNVYEWCEDVWHNNYNGALTDGIAWVSGGDNNSSEPRVPRGGSWLNAPRYCRSAHRCRHVSDDRYFNIGFRVVISVLMT